MSHEKETLDFGTTLTGYGWITYSWVFALSMLGGVANFFRKLKAGAARPFNFAELIGEIIISGFVGVCTFLLCEAARFNPLLSAALIAISGHMGSRAIFQLEQFYTRRLTGAAPVPMPGEPLAPQVAPENEHES